MKILIDTNVLIDYILRREPYTDDAEKIIFLCKNMQIEGCIAAHSIMNIFYILRKLMTLEKRKKFLNYISEFIEIIGIDRRKIISAVNNDQFTDVEDCLQTECAKEFSADYIVTRNVKDFQNSTIPAISPDDFLKKVDLTTI
ncbi:MAG: PIN domain-containing protein [Oscillospiraceae bacterium]|nr:PIN domain-containing protein [Oscillospiraceae bacterium]